MKLKLRKAKPIHYVRPLKELLAEASALGYSVSFVTSCFDHETPFFPAGKTCTDRKRIWISTTEYGYLRSEHEVRCILSHELEHASGSMIATNYPEYGLCCGGFYEPKPHALRPQTRL